MNEDQPLKTFIIYARDDKEYKNQLLRHLQPLVENHFLDVWHDGNILPGEDWEKQIKINLENSELVLVLVSVNCLTSDFIKGNELFKAAEQHQKGNARIVPIIISPCYWQVHKLFNGLQGLPEDMKPVSDWANPHSAWTNIAVSLKTIVDETRAQKGKQLKIQRELEERQRLESLAAERESLLKAEQAEQARIAQEQRNREAAERVRLEEERQKQLAKEAAQRAEAERLQREKQAEWARLHDEAWHTAQKAYTIEALENFCSLYPQSPYSRQARQQIKAIQKQGNASSQTRGKNQNQLLVFGGAGVLVAIFIGIWAIRQCNESKSPVVDSPYSKEDPVKKEIDAWSVAEKADTDTGYKNYLNDYRDGAHAPIARIRLNNFKDSTKAYLLDAERLIRAKKYQNAKPILKKILEKFDSDNAKARKLLEQ